MVREKKIVKAVSVVLFLLMSLPIFGQSLENKLQKAEGLTSYAIIEQNFWKIATEHKFNESSLNLSRGIVYTNWNNTNLRNATGTLNETDLKVDLRNYVMPTPSTKVTSNYGKRWGRMHEGIDIKVYIGDTIVSAFSGTVRIVRNDPRGYGKYVVIRHPNGLETLYGHLSKHLVHVNDVVRAGQPIGLGGNTGRSTGSHLHFEVRILGKAYDPSKFFDFVHQDVTQDFFSLKQK